MRLILYLSGERLIIIAPKTIMKANPNPNKKSPLCNAAPQIALDPPTNAPLVGLKPVGCIAPVFGPESAAYADAAAVTEYNE